jgi:ubiquitin-protein ligase
VVFSNDILLQETADVRWRPILGVETIILSVISMLSDPNDNSPANIDAAVCVFDSVPLLFLFNACTLL